MKRPDNLASEALARQALAWEARWAALMVVLVVALVVSGCGTPGTPQPPSLTLPDRVEDLKAVRTGDRVALTWTMPKRNTDKVLLKGEVAVHVCRREGAGECAAAGDVNFAPGADGVFSETLRAAESSGALRPLSYFVELRNRKGRSAGLSNEADVLAGPAPAPVTGLGAEVRKTGIVLHWNAADAVVAIRLERNVVSAPPVKAKEGPLSAPPEPVEQRLLVEHDGGVALDHEIRFGETYEYRAQRVARQEKDGKTVEAAGEFSAPVRIEALDVFPPERSAGLAAVATAASDTSPAAVDLNWVPNTEADLAGYYVYRREAETPWRRISGEKPVAGPAFHDAAVLAGHTYIYGVSAVDANGNESQRSEDATETVPKQ
jgi:hypothetical protein